MIKMNLYRAYFDCMYETGFIMQKGGWALTDFEKKLQPHLRTLERFILYKISNSADAQDVLQNVLLIACRKQDTLRNEEALRAWLLGIARHQINDYYREKAKQMEVSLETLGEEALSYNRAGINGLSDVADTLCKLQDVDRRILHLYYWLELPQQDIAQKLNIPLGTVKSRLHTAKQRFRSHYPYMPKGEKNMATKLPKILPAYTITPSALPPFSVKWEESMGWMIIPRLGEKVSWGLYDYPTRARTEYTDIEVIGRAQVHGIEGVEIRAVQYDSEDYYRTGAIKEIERRFVAQLTDTHCRYLAESHMEGDIRKCYTFLDGEPFISNWGFGEDNCGSETNLRPKGMLEREGSVITGGKSGETLDVVGRYTVKINGKSYDTICLMDVDCFNDAVACEQYIDKNGRTVLWRRFNRDDWALDRFKQRWSEKLPDNEQLTINGDLYVHWYDCITDYIL